MGDPGRLDPHGRVQQLLDALEDGEDRPEGKSTMDTTNARSTALGRIRTGARRRAPASSGGPPQQEQLVRVAHGVHALGQHRGRACDAKPCGTLRRRCPGWPRSLRRRLACSRRRTWIVLVEWPGPRGVDPRQRPATTRRWRGTRWPAGEGALTTVDDPRRGRRGRSAPAPAKAKSSSSAPSGPTAWARTPLPPGTRSRASMGGTSRWRDRKQPSLADRAPRSQLPPCASAGGRGATRPDPWPWPAGHRRRDPATRYPSVPGRAPRWARRARAHRSCG